VARILVIDDDPAIVDLLRMRLEELGHQVFQAMDATSGMMIAAREKPDLITLDFRMPAGDGGQLLQRLRANTFTAKTKIIFVTGMSEYDLEHAVPDDPSVRYLQKPIDLEILKRMIAELLDGSARAAAAPAPAPPLAERKPVALDGGAFGGDILDMKLPP
jgi:two-component system alkaline phosphatase synthesis response regulator PhoP